MKRILWALAIIIIPAFVFWGAGSFFGERSNYAGVIFGKRVFMDEYVGAWEAVKNEALMSYGPKFREMAKGLDLDAEAWERLIVLHEAKRKRITVSDNEVRLAISRMPFFLDKAGRFDSRTYYIILNNTFRIEPRKFEEHMRENLMIVKLVQGVMLEKEETPGEAAEDAAKRRLQALEGWRKDLYQRAGLVNNVGKAAE